MTFCVNCNIVIHVQFQHYVATDLSPDMVAIIEEWITREITNEDVLCQECFHFVTVENANRLADSNYRGIRQLGHEMVCAWCGLSLSQRRGRRSRPLPVDRAEWDYIANNIHPRSIPNNNARVCNACWQRANNAVRQEVENAIDLDNDVPHDVPHNEADVPNVESISLTSYSRTPNTSRHCFLPECQNSNLHQVPSYLKKRLLEKYKLFVTQRAVICEDHIVVYDWEFLENYEFINRFESYHIEEMLSILNTDSDSILNFENVENMDNRVCQYWTGLSILNFMAILSLIEIPLSEVCKKPKTALAMYLIKLRTADPLRRIASLFLMSKSTVIKYIRKARSILKDHYVPLHLGINHLTRENLSSRNLLIPQGLFGTPTNNPIIICDGTYVYLQKSSNYLFQNKKHTVSINSGICLNPL